MKCFLVRGAAPVGPAEPHFLYWLWNVGAVVCAAVGLGLLSLFLAPGGYALRLALGYFKLPLIALLNLLPVLLLTLLLYFALGRAWAAFLAASAVVMGFSLVNYFKLLFRNDPLLFEDLLLIAEAGNMAGQYDVAMDKRLWICLVCLAVGFCILFFLVRGRPGRPVRLAGCGAVFLAGALLAPVYTSNLVYDTKTAYYEYINQWGATQQYISRGFVYPFLHSITDAVDAPPQGYDEDDAAARLAEYAAAHIPPGQQANVIAVMLEAFNDFTRFDVPGLSDEVYAGYHALEQESLTGNLVTNIFAGGTVDSERCFLTGFSDLGSFRSPTNSYAWYLKSQGYAVTGGHPCFQWFYNRQNINVNLGFDNYRFVENFYSPLTGGGVGNDDVFFPTLIEQCDALLAEDSPFFSFSVTYQGHGPYDRDRTWWGDHYVTGGDYSEADRTILNNYFGSVSNTIGHLTALFDHYRDSQEPVVILLFGDHNPWMGDGAALYHTLGINMDTGTDDGFSNYYTTRYLIWGNGAAKAALGRDFSGAGPEIGPYFLMNQLFDACGWQGDAFMQASDAVMAQVPVLHATGRYMENGILTAQLSPEGERLVSDYDQLQFYRRKNFDY